MSNRFKLSLLGMAALLSSAVLMPEFVQGGEQGCTTQITSCPSSFMFTGADPVSCQAEIPDLRDQVDAELCDEFAFLCVEQTPAPGTLVGTGQTQIVLKAYACFNPAFGDPVTCENEQFCNEVEGTCTTTFDVFAPNPEIICPAQELLTPLILQTNCSVQVPDIRALATISPNCDNEMIVIGQDPAPGTFASVSFPYTSLSIQLFHDVGESSIDPVTCFVPVSPVAECPGTQFGEANPETCTLTIGNYCENYIASCNVEPARANIGTYVCTQTPPEGTALPIGTNEITLSIEYCEDVVTGGDGPQGPICTPRPDLECTFDLEVTAPPPQIICPEEPPVLDPLQVAADCMVVVPDLTGLVQVDACEGAEYELNQYPPAGETIEIFSDSLCVYVELFYGKGYYGSCSFTVPLNPIISCPDSPQQISYDENCEVAVPDLTGGVEYANCCREDDISEGRGLEGGCREFFCGCGEIEVIQIPEAGTIITEPTEVSIIVRRCIILQEDEMQEQISGQIGCESGCKDLGSCVVQLNPVDDTPPVIANCPDDVTFGADLDCLGVIPDLLVPDITDAVDVSDNCTAAADIVLTQTPSAGTEITLGETIVTITATDASGNSTTCSVSVFLEENGCLNPPAEEPNPEPEPQPVPGCDTNNQSLNLLFSFLFHSPVCGATCPLMLAMTICGIIALRLGNSRRRR